MKSFQIRTPVRMATAASPGRVSGSTIDQMMRPSPAPSTRAASSIEAGSAPMKLVRNSTDMGMVSDAYATTSESRLPLSWRRAIVSSRGSRISCRGTTIPPTKPR